jgi:putative alpha-1,2-mannosidase
LRRSLERKNNVRHQEFAKVGKLVFEMGPEPDKDWAAAREDAPYSMSR